MKIEVLTERSTSHAQNHTLTPEHLGRVGRLFDPVCGMDVFPDDSGVEHVVRDDTSYYFCSPTCRKQFESTPEEFSA